MRLVELAEKQADLMDVIRAAAERHRSGLTVERHHRIANEPGAVSARDRDRIMGSPHYYAEVLPTGSPTESETTGGDTTAVAHDFNVFFVFQYEDTDGYEGSTQEEFNAITESLDPKGVLPELRSTSTRNIGSLPVHYRNPTGNEMNIIPAGERGGSLDRVHLLDFNITLVEPS